MLKLVSITFSKMLFLFITRSLFLPHPVLGFMCIVVCAEILILRATIEFRLYMKFRSSCVLELHHTVYGTISRVALVSDFIVFMVTLRASQFRFPDCVVEWQYQIPQELRMLQMQRCHSWSDTVYFLKYV